jgi:hypothetical protein
MKCPCCDRETCGPLLEVGATLYGYCGGYFGRDSHEDKKIEALGSDWIVCRDDEGGVHVAVFKDRDTMLACLLEHLAKKD